MAVTPSRRDFVAMLLGAPVATALGCHRRTRTIDGELIDTGMARGHAAIREHAGGDVRVPDDRWSSARVAVVGGGIAGLSAAWWLARSGVDDVIVLELDDTPGGTARGGASPVTPYPWGAHYIVAPQKSQTELTALLGEMNMIDGVDAAGDPIVDEAWRCRDPEERVYYRGRWYPGLYLYAGATPADLAELARFDAAIDRWVAWRDGQSMPSASPRCTISAAMVVVERCTLAFAASGLTPRRPMIRW
jgi:phytoene dehydrogenase-like protein